jgi:hypothetical protein
MTRYEAKRTGRILFRTYPDIDVSPQKTLCFDCPSRLDSVLDTGESSISELDSRFLGNDGFVINVKERWTHHIRCLPDGA